MKQGEEIMIDNNTYCEFSEKITETTYKLQICNNLLSDIYEELNYSKKSGYIFLITETIDSLINDYSNINEKFFTLMMDTYGN